MFGAERYLSVSTGHTSQFVKAVLLCTPVESLRDQTGRSKREAFWQRPPAVCSRMDLVVSSRAESALPELPTLDSSRKGFAQPEALYRNRAWICAMLDTSSSQPANKVTYPEMRTHKSFL